MENYDLLSLYKYTTKAAGCGNSTESTDGDVTGQTASEEDVQYNVVSGDTATIDGKEVDALGTLSDEDVEEGLKAQNTKSSITDFGIYKTLGLGQTLLDKLKILISWAINGVKPDITPEVPETPTDPIDPADSEDYVELGTDGTDGAGPATDWVTETSEDTYLQRGGAAKTVDISSENESVLILENPFGGENYQYKLSPKTGTNATATFEFLENGRLVVRGDNIKMVANNNQKDDIILLGNNCEIDTGDGDDIVRVGYVADSLQYNITSGSGNGVFSRDSVTYKNSVENKINTGSGNDYVSMLGTNYQIDTGDGGDRVQLLSEKNHNNVSNAEQIYDFQSNTTHVDNHDGWTLQGQIGDCRLFSLINSLCGTKNNGSLSNYVKITTTSSGYEVEFPNYTGTNKKVTISKNDIELYVNRDKYAFGDLDTILVDLAMNKLMAVNNDNIPGYNVDKDNVSEAYYNTIAKYLFGNDQVTFISTGNNSSDFVTLFEKLWNDYSAGEISNLTVGIHDRNTTSTSTGIDKLGIIYGHAYAVRNVVTGTNGYIELINPWDDADCLKISLSDFYTEYYIEAQVYGKKVFENMAEYYWSNGGDDDIIHISGSDQNFETDSSLTVRQTITNNQVPELKEVKETKQNIEQIKSLINIAKSKTIKELS